MPGTKHIDQYVKKKINMVSKLEHGLLNIPLVLPPADTALLPSIVVKEKVL